MNYPKYATFFIARTLAGLASGMNLTVSMVFLKETSAVELYPIRSGINQFMSLVGGFIGMVLGIGFLQN